MCLGIPGRVEEILCEEPLVRSAKISFGGITKEINVAYVPEAGVGDYVIVHAGFAITQINQEEAQRIFQYLSELGDLEDLHQS